jgi:cob(I)alamin adenosyltransferase
VDVVIPLHDGECNLEPMTIRINRVYTKSGDQGETSLVGGDRVPKDALRIEAYGTVDELNAALGVAVVELRRSAMPPEPRGRLDALLQRLQNELFDLGADLATPVAKRHPQQAVIEPGHAEALEKVIDEWNEGLPELTSFILPGGGAVAAQLHVARTICRRAERVTARLRRHAAVGGASLVYLNRLSDLLFVLSRWAAKAAGEPETLWKPGSR